VCTNNTGTTPLPHGYLISIPRTSTVWEVARVHVVHTYPAHVRSLGAQRWRGFRHEVPTISARLVRSAHRLVLRNGDGGVRRRILWDGAERRRGGAIDCSFGVPPPRTRVCSWDGDGRLFPAAGGPLSAARADKTARRGPFRFRNSRINSSQASSRAFTECRPSCQSQQRFEGARHSATARGQRGYGREPSGLGSARQRAAQGGGGRKENPGAPRATRPAWADGTNGRPQPAPSPQMSGQRGQRGPPFPCPK